MGGSRDSQAEGGGPALGPLDGVIVVDFSTLLPGPLATLILAEAGADVVKVERPGTGDEMRSYEPKWDRNSVNFAMLNRGKRSLEVDLKDETARGRVLDLLAGADVLVEQFRPGVMDRLGLSYQDVKKVNPGLIYCSITGYGQTGPKSGRAGHDLNYVGDSGLLSLVLDSDSEPVLPPALVADIAGGSYPAVMNILLALMQRDRTGKGCHIDLAMSENVLPFLYWALGNGQVAGDWPEPHNELLTGGSPRYNLYRTEDGGFVAAAPLEERFWKIFVEAIDLDSRWRDDEKDPIATRRQVAEVIKSRPSEHWRRVFADNDCCCSVVRTVQEAFDDDHMAERGVFARRVSSEHGASISALPLPIDPSLRMGSRHDDSVPSLGSDNQSWLP